MLASLFAEHVLWGIWTSVVAGHGLSSCGSWDLVAPLHVGPSWTRDRTRVP